MVHLPNNTLPNHTLPKIILLGLNHKTAPIELREKLAFSDEDSGKTLELLHKTFELKEVILFSTCNRMEIIAVTDNINISFETIKKTVADIKDISIDEFESSLYTYHGDDAVKHLFRVASSLDSMMVGEPQILGQIKVAYNTAASKKTTGVILNRLLHKTFTVAKKVRTETGIGDNAISISYAAIELGRKIFGTLEGKKVLLMGAGEMAELAVEHLIRHKAKDIFVANRTFERGSNLAKKFNGKAIKFEEIQEFLSYIDIVISSTGSQKFIVTQKMVKNIMKKRRNNSLFFIDIAVPRDIDPLINRLDNAYVYDIDDLKNIIEDNIEERSKEAIKGERIVEEAVILFKEWYKNLSVIPTVVDLKRKMENIANKEIEKTFKLIKGMSENDCQAIERMVGSIITKILHDPIYFLKNPDTHKDNAFYLNVARNIFKL